MKMPTSKPIGNGYYGYGDPSYLNDDNIAENNVDRNELIPPENQAPAVNCDFSEYLWMENEEEFDKEVMQKLEEEALMEQCIEAMLDDERENRQPYQYQPRESTTQWSINNDAADVVTMMNNLQVQNLEVTKESTLNPLAAEFVPMVRSEKQTSNFHSS